MQSKSVAMIIIILAIFLLAEVSAQSENNDTRTIGPKYTECPCLAADEQASFEKKTGLYFMVYGYGFPEFNCATIVFRNEVKGVELRSFKANYKGNGSHIIWHGRNFKIQGDRFFAYDANNDKMQYSISFYHNYDRDDGCLGILCCLLYDPNLWQVLVFCRKPNPSQEQIDEIMYLLERKYQPYVPEKLDLFKINHPGWCEYNKLVQLIDGKPNYQSIDVDKLEVLYSNLSRTDEYSEML